MPSNAFKKSSLTHAVFHGDVELILLLLEQGADVEEKNEGCTPLMVAAGNGHEEIVALLLSHGAEINALSEDGKETALTIACGRGFLEVADLLIKEDADIELGYNTPLMLAAQEGHLEMVRYLILSGANVMAKNAAGDTALICAFKNIYESYNHTQVVNLLQSHNIEFMHTSPEFHLAHLSDMERIEKLSDELEEARR